MNFCRCVSLGFLVALTSTACIGQTPASRFETFLSSVASNTDSAIDDLFAGSGLSTLKPQELVNLRAQMKAFFAVGGKPKGFEKVSETDLAPSLKKLVYIQKFEQAPVAWVAYFYRSNDTWVANTVNIVNEYAKLLNSYP